MVTGRLATALLSVALVSAVLLSAAACGTSTSGGTGAVGGTGATAAAGSPAVHPATTGSSGANSVGATTAGPGSAARGSAAVSAGDCPTRGAWATDVTAAGRIAWQVRLPTAARQQGVVVQPLVVAGAGVFAEENAVYAISLDGGRELWHRGFSKDVASLAGAVYGMWAGAPGTVVVLTGQVTHDARLTELNAATGAVGWTLPLPAELYGSQALAAGHTLAVLEPDGDLAAVDLVTGRVLWSRRVGTSAGPATVGSVIASGGSAVATGYQGASGGPLLWTAAGLPAQTNLTAADGLFLAWNNAQGAGSDAAVTALNPATGQVEWRFDPGPNVSVLGAGPAGIVFAAYAPNRVYLVSPATGRVRWSVGQVAPLASQTPGGLVVTAGQVVTVGSAPTGTSSGLTVRNAADGRVEWSASFGAGWGNGVSLALLPLPSGQAGQAIAATAWQDATSSATRLTVDRLATGARLGQVTLPDLVMAPLTVAGAGILAQTDSPGCADAAPRVAAVGAG